MLLQNFQEIFIRCAAAYVSLTVLEDTNEADIVIICGQIRFHIRKIAYVDRHIFTFTVPVRIDQTALFERSTQVTDPAFRERAPVMAPQPLPTSSTLSVFLIGRKSTIFSRRADR